MSLTHSHRHSLTNWLYWLLLSPRVRYLRSVKGTTTTTRWTDELMTSCPSFPNPSGLVRNWRILILLCQKIRYKILFFSWTFPRHSNQMVEFCMQFIFIDFQTLFRHFFMRKLMLVQSSVTVTPSTPFTPPRVSDSIMSSLYKDRSKKMLN